jgi:tagaturonate reductase
MGAKSFKEGIVKMQLSRDILSKLNGQQLPAEELFSLPEKVLQFGTGVLLRGLPDHFIDKANKQDVFNGRIVVVKSTSNGGTDAFDKQDGLYTLVERGVENGALCQNYVVNASISRVISAREAWEEVLACAANPQMQLIISNTTEVGIALVESDAHTDTPVSFPGRLLAFLEHRYKTFNGSHESGMVIIPTELLVDNGILLKNIVVRLAELKGASEPFMNWLRNANDFCNSLVDCIVPGKLPAAEQAQVEQQLGYSDELMIMSEPYRLWAIETSNERTRDILSFSKSDSSVVISPDINRFRELKLRLLNATHTFSCGLAYLAGFRTVKEAMNDRGFAEYISALMLQEIVPLVAQNGITVDEANRFAAQVLDRFRNPYIEHQWLSITMQYTSKMMMRTVPLLEKHYARFGETPELMALGFAAWLLFTRPVEKSGDQYFAEYNGNRYPLQDDKASLLHKHWTSAGPGAVAEAALKDVAVLGMDLTQFKGLAEAIQVYLASLIEKGADGALRSEIIKKSVA